MNCYMITNMEYVIYFVIILWKMLGLAIHDRRSDVTGEQSLSLVCDKDNHNLNSRM